MRSDLLKYVSIKVILWHLSRLHNSSFRCGGEEQFLLALQRVRLDFGSVCYLKTDFSTVIETLLIKDSAVQCHRVMLCHIIETR